MKTKVFILILGLSIWGSVYAQITVNKGIYKSNFSNTLHEPKYVSYYLYRGGGNCKNDGYRFKNEDARLQCAVDSDYAGRGYDKGHLANAEDFASDCTNDELTFRYYNCLPQTPNLNRGIWKTKETLIRKWSQTQKLYIICGGYFGKTKIGNIVVPSYCWKVVQSVTTKKVLFCGWFGNTTPATFKDIKVPELEMKLKAHIILLK
jgi:DNA/RNA endonuclease G (NUC1)